MDFGDHVKYLMKKLELDAGDVTVLEGCAAKRYAVDNHELYLKELGVSLKEYLFDSDKTNGIFLWQNKKPVVLVKNKQLIGTLAHEMRHAWQYKNKEKKKFKIKVNILNNHDGKFIECLKKIHYTFISRVELDANRYAFYHCIRCCIIKEWAEYLVKSFPKSIVIFGSILLAKLCSFIF